MMVTDEEEEDQRLAWLKKKICFLLLQNKNWNSAEFMCPLKPLEDVHVILRNFLDDEPLNAMLFFFSPPTIDDDDDDDDDDASTDEHMKDPLTTMSSFQWESGDTLDSDSVENSSSSIPILHVIEGLPPANLGIEGIIVRKAVNGKIEAPIPDDEDSLSMVLHLSFLNRNYRRGLQEVFNMVYLPLMERLGKNDPTGYLSFLSKGLMRITEVNKESSPFESKGSIKEESESSDPFGMPSGARRKALREAGIDEEGEEDSVVRKNPKDILFRSLLKLKNKFTKVPESNTLIDLKRDWESSFIELSNSLAFVLSHPVVIQMEKDDKREKDKMSKKRQKLKHKTARGSKHPGKEKDIILTEDDHLRREQEEEKERKETMKYEVDDDETSPGEERKELPEEVTADDEKLQIQEDKTATDEITEVQEVKIKVQEEEITGKEDLEFPELEVSAKDKELSRSTEMSLRKKRKLEKAKKKRRLSRMQALKEAEEETTKRIKSLVAYLVRLHSELSDCRRSLRYLENCFKVVEAGQIEELGGKSLALLETLEIVWRVGRRNGISGRVQVLLEASVQSLVDVVTRDLRPVNLLPASMRELIPLKKAQKKVDNAEAVVSEWENTVSIYASIIRNSAKRRKDGRHDFDPKKVVGLIQGLKSVCQDLQAILKELLEVQVVLSSEWSSLIITAKSDTLRTATSQVLKILTAYDFNIFSPRNKDRWTRQQEDFGRALQEWEKTTQKVIFESFKNRLTSELVSAVAVVLKKEPCRPVFRELLLSHLPTLMSEFMEEVKGIEEDFAEQRKEDRPGSQAPVAGRVRWMSAYLTRKLSAWSILKDLYLKHKTDTASIAMVEEVGLMVESVRKEVERFRTEEVERWIADVNRDIPRLLVSPVLTKDEACEGSGWAVELPGALQTIVWESGQLVQGGFQPPPLALHFSLHYPTLQSAAMTLQITLKEYNEILDALNPIQKQVLCGELTGTEKVLEAGRRVVTWSPASLTHFSKSCKGVIDHVTGVTTKLINISYRLEDFLRIIKTTNFMSSTRAAHGQKSSKSLPSFHEYLELCDQNREEQMKHLQETYERFVATLKATSSLLITSSDTCPSTLSPHLNTAPDNVKRMEPFLNHWHQNIQRAITDLLVGTMNRLQKTLKGVKGQDGLFEIDADLMSSGVLVLATPSRNLVSSLSLTLGQIVRCAMIFRHWRVDEFGGAFLEDKQTIDEDTLAASSFYDEISKEGAVHEAILTTQNCFADVVKEVDIELQKWYAYEHIWQRDKSRTVQKFFKKSSSIRQIDDKLRFYKELTENLQESKQHILCHCIRLNVETLIKQINHHASMWIQLIGLSLKQKAEYRLQDVIEQLTEVENSLAASAHDMESLRRVLFAVREVRSNFANFSSSLQVTKVMFHILNTYGIVEESTHIVHVESTISKVEKLHIEATKAKIRVNEPYMRYQGETLQKLTKFKEKVNKFETQFKKEGPGSVGENLESGIELMKIYSQVLMDLTKEKDLLEKDVDMFDLPEIRCEPIQEITDAMNILSDIYNIYKKLKVVELSWKSLRFQTVRLSELENDLADLQVSLDTIPELSGSDITKQLHSLIDGHFLNLKVVASLRNSALEQRHWNYLMSITIGEEEEKDSDAFKKGSVLSVWEVLQMSLSKHPDWVAKCVYAAKMETKVHERIEEIYQFWRNLHVGVDTSNNIWHIDGIKELEDTLQDHNLSLKTLQSSRFSAPSAAEIDVLFKTLLNIDNLLQNWSSLRSNMKILLHPSISSRLQGIDEISASYRQILETTRRRPLVIELSSKDNYLKKLRVLLSDATKVLVGVQKVLFDHRCICSRLYYLNDSQLTALVVNKNPIDYLQVLVNELFNNVSSLVVHHGNVTGLQSVEGEELRLVKRVEMLPGDNVSNGMKQLIEEMKRSTKIAFEKAQKDLKDSSLRSSIIESNISAQVQNGWLVWWTADVEDAISRIQTGNRNALREVFGRVSEGIKTVLNMMDRLVYDHTEYASQSHSKSVKTSPNLSESRKTWSTSVQLQDTPSEKDQPLLTGSRQNTFRNAIERSQRLQPLLLLLLRCRDVMAELMRRSIKTKSSFLWQIQPRYYMDEKNNLVLRAMHKQVMYEFEYRGCGMEDYVLSVSNESSVIAFLTALASHKPILMQGRNGCEASGRQSMVNFVAHLTGNFLYSLNLNCETSSESIMNFIKGALISGYFLLFKHPELAPNSTLSFIGETVFHLHYAFSHPDSPQIVQLGKDDIVVHPSAGFILLPMSPDDCGRKVIEAMHIPATLLSLCQPIGVSRPNLKDLLHALLLVNNAPQPYLLSNSVYEIIRHFKSPNGGPLPLYTRQLKMIVKSLIPCFVAESDVMLDLAIQTCSNVIERWVPKTGREHRESVCSQLTMLAKPGKELNKSPKTEEMDESSIYKEICTTMTALKNAIIESQIGDVHQLIKVLQQCDKNVVLVSGPPCSGKATIIEAACEMLEKFSDTFFALDKGRTRHKGDAEKHHKALDPNQKVNERDSDVFVIEDRSNSINKFTYFIACHCYDDSTLFGCDDQPGILPSLIRHLGESKSNRRRYIALEGPSAGKTFLKLRQSELDHYTNVIFIIKTTWLLNVPESVVSRSNIYQIRSNQLSIADLLHPFEMDQVKRRGREPKGSQSDDKQEIYDYREDMNGETGDHDVHDEDQDQEMQNAPKSKDCKKNEKEEDQRIKGSKSFSVDDSLTTNDIFFYLLEPFVTIISQEKSTIIPYSSVAFVQQCQSILKFLSMSVQPKTSESNAQLYDYHKPLKNRENIILIIDAVLRTSCSVFKDEAQQLIDDILRPKIKKFIRMKWLADDEKQEIETLIGNPEPLINYFWNSRECTWNLLKHCVERESEVKIVSEESPEDGSEMKSQTSAPTSFRDGEVSLVSLKKETSSTESIERDAFIDPLLVEMSKLENSLLPLMKNEKPLLIIGPKGFGKTTSVMKILKNNENVNVVHFLLSYYSTSRDFEKTFLLKIIEKSSVDTMEPSRRTVLVINNLEKVKARLEVIGYIESLFLQRGFFHPLQKNRWFTLKNIYIISILSLPLELLAEEREEWSYFRGFAIHSFTHETQISENLLKTYLFPSLEEDVANPMLKATLKFLKTFQNIVRFDSQLSHVSTIFRLSSIFSFLLRKCSVLESQQGLLTARISEDETGGEHEGIYSIWHVVMNKEFIWPLVDLKVMQREEKRKTSSALISFYRRRHLLNIINVTVKERVSKLLNEIIAEDLDLKFLSTKGSPIPLWLKSNFPAGMEAELNFELLLLNDADKLPDILQKEDSLQGDVSSELHHSGVANAFLCLVSFIVVGTCCFSTSIQLIIFPPTSDLYIILKMTAKYLERKLVSCATSERALFTLEKLFSFEESFKMETEAGKKILIVISCKFLKSKDLRKCLHEIATKARSQVNERDQITILLTATEMDTKENFPEDLLSMFARGASGILRLLPFEPDQNLKFIREKLLQVNFDTNLVSKNADKICTFLVYVHQSLIDETLQRKLCNIDYENPSPRYEYPLPSVNALKLALNIFIEYLLVELQNDANEVTDLRLTISRSQDLESYLTELKTRHSEITSDIEKTTTYLSSVNKDIENKKSQIGREEAQLENLRQELAAAMKSEEELSNEVSEYEEETRKPLQEVLQELSTVDMERVKKLVAFSPVTAVQLVFEGAVTVLGVADATWKDVRHATNDPTFCDRLISLNVPALTEDQVTAVTQKFQQIKITDEHMARLSDIGSILFKYLKTAMFLWRRFHEDILPRRERVEVLKTNTQQLQKRISNAEVTIQNIRCSLQNNSVTLKTEEARIVSFNERATTLENDFKEVEKVIKRLEPHTQGWRDRLDWLLSESNRPLERCLMDSVKKSYLAAVPAQMRTLLEGRWRHRLDLTDDSVQKENNLSTRLVTGLDGCVTSIIEHYRGRSGLPYLVVKDSHHMESVHFVNSSSFYLSSEDWRNNLEEVIKRSSHSTDIIVHGEHPIISECIDWLNMNVTDENVGEIPFIIFCLEDDCCGQLCFLCSCHVVIDLSLNPQEMENIFCRTLLKKWGTIGEAKDKLIQDIVHKHKEAKIEREKGCQKLMQILIDSTDMHDPNFLNIISEQANALSKMINQVNGLKDELLTLNSEVCLLVLNTSKYGIQIYELLNILRRLSTQSCIHFRALKMVFAAMKESDNKTQTKDTLEMDMRRRVTNVTLNLLKPRLSSIDYLIVETVLSIVSLPSSIDIKCILRALLEPMEEEGEIWKGIRELAHLTNVEQYKKVENEEKEWNNLLKRMSFWDRVPSDEMNMVIEWEDPKQETNTSSHFQEIENVQGSKLQNEEKIRLKFKHIKELCGTLFDDFTDVHETYLVNWVEGTEKMMIWPSITEENALKQSVKRVILSRHFHPTSLLNSMKTLIKVTSSQSLLNRCENPLAEAVHQCPFFRLPSKQYSRNVILVEFNSCLRLDLFIRSTASKLGVKQYKIIPISLPRLSIEEMHKFMLKNSRRGTWLVINDSEMVPNGIKKIANMLNSLPDDTPPPVIICPLPKLDGRQKLKQNIAFRKNCDVTVNVEGSVDFRLSLRSLQTLSRTYPKTENELAGIGYIIFAAVSFIHSLICARQSYKSHGWIFQAFVGEEDLKSGIELATFYICDSNVTSGTGAADGPPWDAITNGLKEIVYKHVTSHHGDLELIGTLLGGYLSDALLLHSDQKDTSVETVMGELSSYECVRRLCWAPTVDDEIIAELENREETFLNLEKEEYIHYQEEIILSDLQVYTKNKFVSVPVHIVQKCIFLLKSLTRGNLQSFIENTDRQRDFETLAWEEEIKAWEDLCHRIEVHIQYLYKVSDERCITPCEMLISLSQLLEHYILQPFSISTDSVNCQRRLNDDDILISNLKFKERRNFLPKEKAITCVTLFVKGCQHLKERFDQLLYWAEHESPPPKVKLGFIQWQDYWLCQFRRAVCSRAHWNLKGSLVYAYPASAGTYLNERPPQAVFLVGCQIRGGIWKDGMILQHGEKQEDLTLVLTVSHSKPVAKWGQIWVPIVDSKNKHKVIFEALLPVDSSFKLSTELLHIVLNQ